MYPLLLWKCISSITKWKGQHGVLQGDIYECLGLITNAEVRTELTTILSSFDFFMLKSKLETTVLNNVATLKENLIGRVGLLVIILELVMSGFS